jgi:hypothetical protein
MKHEGIQPCLAAFSSCWLVTVGCYGFACQVYLSVVVVCCWLSTVGCWVLNVDCRLSLLVVVVGSLLSGVGCWLSVSTVAHFFPVAGVLDEPYSQLIPLSWVAVQARKSMSILELAGRYNYSAELALLSRVRRLWLCLTSCKYESVTCYLQNWGKFSGFRFNAGSAERHIPLCKNIKSNKG